MKITTKTWLHKVPAIFTHRTNHLHGISLLGSFYSKAKRFIFLASIHLLVFWFFLSMWCLNDFLFSCYKAKTSKMDYWRGKTKQLLSEASYHIICSSKKNSSRISHFQLSVSYILRENSLSEEKFFTIKIL